MALALAHLTLQEGACNRPRAVSENEGRFSEVVRAYEAQLLAIARKLCGNDADARDLVHDSYERALRAWDRYADRGNLRGWLVAIMHNLFIDRCRKAKRDPRTEAIDDVELATPEAETPPTWANVTADQVSRALDRLDADFRDVYRLHVAGRSYAEIAAALGIPTATVGTRLLRARKKLKDVLLHEIGGEP